MHQGDALDSAYTHCWELMYHNAFILYIDTPQMNQGTFQSSMYTFLAIKKIRALAIEIPASYT